MGNNLNHNKPANPAPPLNAKKSPEVKHEADKAPVRRSVYDEIAERRKREKHKIGVTTHESVDEKPRSIDEIGDIIDELKQNREDDDVKVYNPDKKHAENISSHSEPQSVEISEFTKDIYSDDDEREKTFDDEENYDVPPIPKAPRRIGLWVALISALSVLCVIAAGAYGLVNGYFDGLISML